jgi:endonuclease-3
MIPHDLPAVLRRLRRYYVTHDPPVRRFEATRGRDPWRILVATILSARARDQVTAPLCQRLFERAPTPEALKTMPLPELESFLRPLGFFRSKARHLKALPGILEREFRGEIPRTREGLLRLPGVGPKTANLVLAEAFSVPAICVDVHVHRISNRFGLVHTRTPRQTEAALKTILPRTWWNEWNRYLVALGQTLCLPRRPRCERCPVRPWCATGSQRQS